jgi:N-acetylmuramic acid 6-phosphate etherase
LAAKRVTKNDVVVGIAASGSTPYVLGALKFAQRCGAVTVGIASNRSSALMRLAKIGIAAETGPEIIAGSTRMKAGTAQKMVTNMITTGAMTRLGYVYDNLMVNVHMKNAKLVERGIRVLMKVCDIDRDTAIRTIKSAGKSIPIAVVMLKAGVDKMEAVRRLSKSDGNVRLAIEDSRLEI